MLKVEKLLFSMLLFIVIYGIYLTHTNIRLFEVSVAQEGGPIEWFNVFALMSGMFVGLFRVLRSLKYQTKAFRYFNLLCAILFFWIAGEEISWGEKIYLNNNPTLRHGLNWEIILALGLILFLFAIPYLYNSIHKFKTYGDIIGFPIPRKHHGVCLGITITLGLFIRSSCRYQLMEFTACTLGLMVILNPLNREIYFLPEDL